LLKIYVLTGGTKSNKIVSKSETRSIVQIRNDDTMCCVRSINVCLAYTHIETLQSVFRYNLTEEDIKKINYKRQKKNYTNINNGEFSENELDYLRQEDKSLLTNLAIAFHRIFNFPIKQSGNDLIDINNIAKKLNI